MDETLNTGLHADAGDKIHQLLSFVLEKHAPYAADVSEEAKERYRAKFLDELEDHTADITGPLIETLLATGKVPPEIATLLKSIHDPEHAVSAIASQFLVFGVGFAVANQLVTPFLQELANTLWSTFPTVPLSPAVVATAITQAVDYGDSQGVEIPSWAYDTAKKSGMSNEDFATLVGADGQAPDYTALSEMFRRGIIDDEKFRDGFLEGPTKNKWIPYLEKLRYTTPTPVDMVRAAVQDQMPYEQAAELASELGLEPPGFVNDNPDWFRLLYNIAGRPPGPQEAGHMANRRIIPWTGTGPDATTFQQVIAESDLKTKYTSALAALQVYLPPPRTVGSLLEKGGITPAQAKDYWEKSGVASELADAYVYEATHQATIQEKNLAKGDVLKAYHNLIIDKKTALELLDLLGFSGQVAATMLALQDMQRELKAMNSEVNRVGSYYQHFKITEVVTTKALTELGLPADQIKGLLEIWSVERGVPSRIPTPIEIGKAYKSGTLTQEQGLARLELLGYTKLDAAIVLAANSDAQISPLPDQTPPAINV